MRQNVVSNKGIKIFLINSELILKRRLLERSILALQTCARLPNINATTCSTNAAKEGCPVLLGLSTLKTELNTFLFLTGLASGISLRCKKLIINTFSLLFLPMHLTKIL